MLLPPERACLAVRKSGLLEPTSLRHDSQGYKPVPYLKDKLTALTKDTQIISGIIRVQVSQTPGLISLPLPRGSYCNKWKRMRDKPPWEHEPSDFNSPEVSHWIPLEASRKKESFCAVRGILRNQDVHWLHHFTDFQFCPISASVGSRTSFHFLPVCTKHPGGQN